MSDDNNDEVADALAALAGGQPPSEDETPSGGIPSETTVFSLPPTDISADPATDNSAKAPAVRPLPTPPSLPVSPTTADSSRPRHDTSAKAATRAAAARPSPPNPPPTAPAARGDTPAARSDNPGSTAGASKATEAIPPPGSGRLRAAAPERRAAPAQIAVPAPAPDLEEPAIEASDEIIDVEELEMDAPAPDLSSFIRAPVVKQQRGSLSSNLFYRRTLIPILLTCGLMLPALGFWTLLDRNSPLQETGRPFLILLIVVGLVLFVLAVLNMLHVRQILRAQSETLR